MSITITDSIIKCTFTTDPKTKRLHVHLVCPDVPNISEDPKKVQLSAKYVLKDPLTFVLDVYGRGNKSLFISPDNKSARWSLHSEDKICLDTCADFSFNVIYSQYLTSKKKLISLERRIIIGKKQNLGFTISISRSIMKRIYPNLPQSLSNRTKLPMGHSPGKAESKSLKKRLPMSGSPKGLDKVEPWMNATNLGTKPLEGGKCSPR